MTLRPFALASALFALSFVAALPHGSAQTCGTIASVENLAGGSPGTHGVPILAYNGSPIVGNPFGLKVSNALPNSVAVFAASAGGTPIALPQYAAVQHLLPPFFAFEVRPIDADGLAKGFLGQAALAPETCGIEFHAQVLVPTRERLGSWRSRRV